MQIIELPPIAPTLIESTRAIGYSLEASIADIIDNSVAANASFVEISFFPLHGAYISILDDGKGMDPYELTKAMQYGSQNPLDKRNDNDLGRYGLGLKTASLSQCKILTVVSKKNGIIQARRWDINFIRETRKWTLIDLSEDDELCNIRDIDKLKQLDSGTLVVWEELDRMREGTIDFEKSMGKQIDIARKHLALVYHRYLSAEQGLKKLVIKINGIEIEPADPFLIKKSDQTMQEEVYKIHGSYVKVQPFILPHISKMTASELKRAGGKEGLRKQQGFYIYRNKRLLVWGTWFRMMRKGELSKLARIRVDIPNTLDNLWTLDIKKSSAIPPEEIKENLSNVIDKIGDKSKVKFTRRGKIETDDTQIHLWNRMRARDGGYYYEINRKHPIVEALISIYGNSRQLFALLTHIERSLPLNQIYIDLNNDELIKNDKRMDDTEIEAMIKDILLKDFNKQEQISFIEKLFVIQPFKNYEKVLNKIIREISES